MVLRERMLTLAASTLAAVLLNAMLLMTALAESDADGDGFDGDELLLPLGVLAVIIVGGVALWRARRNRTQAE